MPTLAESWQQRQRQIADATAAAALQTWQRMDVAAPQATFEAALPQLVASVTAGQLAAATTAAEYVATVVREDGLESAPVAVVPPRRFAGLASDGRSLVGLLTQPLLRTLFLRTQGADDATALAGGRLSLQTLVSTEVHDTARDAVQVAAALEPAVIGHVRVVSLPACDRCIVLAGRVYSHSKGFRRHPRCDCSMRLVTGGSDPASPQTPRELFDAMDTGQQDRAFGKDKAEVIRRGGDLGKVVNARRGMATAGSNWTTEGTTKRGEYGRNRQAPRPSPGALLRFARTPDEFVRALERAGYL
jgi:hypothetical protein